MNDKIDSLEKKRIQYKNISESQMLIYKKKRDLENQLHEINVKTSQIKSSMDHQELYQMKNVLRKLKFEKKDELQI